MDELKGSCNHVIFRPGRQLGVCLSERRERLIRWVGEFLGTSAFALTPASSDASFRSYWRVQHASGTLIVMDAPPGLEDCRRFVDLARRLGGTGLHTPEIYAEDPTSGFLALSDLGDRVYLRELNPESVDRLYGDALSALAVLQARGPTQGLPVYDGPFLGRELEIFREWYLGTHLDVTLNPDEELGWERLCRLLIDNALEQPQVCVHRDYHSRNLMVTQPNPGILDFQDAVVGPVTYDLVSLLRDCYVAWEPERVTDWALGYLGLAVRSGIMPEVNPERFLRWFDLMGVQRHLKACGIFARLRHRDGKPGYLADIPRTLGYVRAVCTRIPELEDLRALLRGHIDGRLPVPARG